MTRVDERGDGHAHAGGIGHDVVIAVAIPVVEPAGELRHARRDGRMRRAELEPSAPSTVWDVWTVGSCPGCRLHLAAQGNAGGAQPLRDGGSHSAADLHSQWPELALQP